MRANKKRTSRNVELFNEIDDVFDRIVRNLEDDSSNNVKVITLFARNSSGKTRLSKHICDLKKGSVLYYNAYTEDLFIWDNDKFVLMFDSKNKFLQIIKLEGLEEKVEENFNKFTGLNIITEFDFDSGRVRFYNKDSSAGSSEGNETATDVQVMPKTNEENRPLGEMKYIKISRGEESVFVLSVFYTILKEAINELNSEKENWNKYAKYDYVVIDDPVSSMDDTRIITVAIELAELISESKNKLNFLITTHHALFFNVLLYFSAKNWSNKCFTLIKSEENFLLKLQSKYSPFAYHHFMISEIKKAIKKGKIEKYHFNLFRKVLEKTNNFLGGAGNWKKLLRNYEQRKIFVKTLHQYSHDSLSDLDSSELSESEKKEFKRVFEGFIEDFQWFNKKEDRFDSSDTFFWNPYRFIIQGYESQRDVFNLHDGPNVIVETLRNCCEQATNSNTYEPKSVKCENNKVILKVSLFDAAVLNENTNIGFIADFHVSYMKFYSTRNENQSKILQFLPCEWDAKKIEENVKEAIKSYGNLKYFESEIKETGKIGKNKKLKPFKPSKLFDGNIHCDGKNIWIKNEEEV